MPFKAAATALSKNPTTVVCWIIPIRDHLLIPQVVIFSVKKIGEGVETPENLILEDGGEIRC